MKRIQKSAENKNYTAVNIGSLQDLAEYSMVHPKTKATIKGKVFLKKATRSTGTEISFNALPPKTDVRYFHIHNKDEETYIILQGEGFYQVDDDCFPIAEGSVIRVSPAGVRSLCNTSETTMVYLCVQSKENSLEEHTTDDGTRINYLPKWK